MFNRIVIVLVVVPLAIILISLAVANRTVTPFTLDPFNPGNPGLTVELPLFIYLFGAVVVGMFVGSVATWFSQGRYRRIARERSRELEKLRAADRQKSATALARTDI